MRRLTLVTSLSIFVASTTGCDYSDNPGDSSESLGEVASALSGSVLFVAGSTSLNAADTAVRNRLQSLGFTVTVKAATSSTTADATGKALVVVSSTVSSADVGTKFRDVAVPVVTWENALFDDMQLTPASAGSFGTTGSQQNLTIASPGHPMAAGLSGTVAATTSTSTFTWGHPGAAAVKIATLPASSNDSAIFGYDTGSALVNGQAAPARRVGLFFSDSTASVLSSNGWALFDKAIEWSVGSSASQNVVTLDVTNVDDFLYVTVNGVRRKVVPWQSNQSQTISDWFVPGVNTVRIQAVNTGGPASYSVQLAVDGATVVSASCASAPCTALPGGNGIVFDQTYQVTTPNRPAARTLTVNGTAGGQIYLNDGYTGFTAPHTFTLPQGSYVVGLGVGEGTPGAYVGQYYEQTAQLGASNVTVTPSAGAPLSFPNHTKIALLPIRNTLTGTDPQNTGVLTDNDITVMFGQTLATREQYVKPFSYGLTTWDVDLLPTVENTPLHRNADSGDAGDADRLLAEAGLTSLKTTYDSIIYFYSKYTSSGTEVVNGPCCFWGGGQGIWFPNHTTRGGASANEPNVYLLHESLHDYESYNDSRLHFYNGADGLHGAGTHGYVGGQNGEADFLLFYRRFMRNQVAEVNTMRGGVNWTSGTPTSGDLWIGVFDTMRRDVNWQTAGAAAGATLAARAAVPVRSVPMRPLAQPAPTR
jgi:hypothetical protein